jgi:hypothetical protein
MDRTEQRLPAPLRAGMHTHGIKRYPRPRDPVSVIPFLDAVSRHEAFQ